MQNRNFATGELLIFCNIVMSGCTMIAGSMELCRTSCVQDLGGEVTPG